MWGHAYVGAKRLDLDVLIGLGIVHDDAARRRHGWCREQDEGSESVDPHGIFGLFDKNAAPLSP